MPEVDPNDYELEITGRSIKTIHLSLEDIKTKFKKHTITSTIQCAGNRRSELNSVSLVLIYCTVLYLYICMCIFQSWNICKKKILTYLKNLIIMNNFLA